MNKLDLIISIAWVNNIQVEAKYQTPIDKNRVHELVEGWNTIILNLDDPQDLYLELSRFAYNRLLMGHMLVDGNKRMHRALTLLINEFIKYKDIL